MGGRELLDDMAQAGFRIEATGDGLLIRPAANLTDELRDRLRAAKPELVALLRDRQPAQFSARRATGYGESCLAADRAAALSKAEADEAHREPWDDAACATFVRRVARFVRLGISDAHALATRLHLRDVRGDDRVVCCECQHYRAGHCARHRQAGLHSTEVGLALATTLQRCPAAATANVGDAAPPRVRS